MGNTASIRTCERVSDLQDCENEQGQADLQSVAKRDRWGEHDVN